MAAPAKIVGRIWYAALGSDGGMPAGRTFVLADVHDFLLVFVHFHQPRIDFTDPSVCFGLGPHLGLDKGVEIVGGGRWHRCRHCVP